LTSFGVLSTPIERYSTTTGTFANGRSESGSTTVIVTGRVEYSARQPGAAQMRSARKDTSRIRRVILRLPARPSTFRLSLRYRPQANPHTPRSRPRRVSLRCLLRLCDPTKPIRPQHLELKRRRRRGRGQGGVVLVGHFQADPVALLQRLRGRRRAQ